MSKDHPSFTDAEGRRWAPFITGDTVYKYEIDTGISLFEAIIKGGATGAVPGMKELFTLICLSVEDQLAERKITFEMLRKSMHGKALAEAKDSIQEAIYNFFPELKDMAEVKTEASTDPNVRNQG